MQIGILSAAPGEKTLPVFAVKPSLSVSPLETHYPNHFAHDPQRYLF